jgi:probable phosphoglycerate mutase
MTQFLFVRHATHDFLAQKKIAGRRPGIHLNPTGKKQAEELARRLSVLPIEAIYCSPLERACETAAPLAEELSLEPKITGDFNEIDFGDWTGRAFVDLDCLPGWQRWNRFRSNAVAPNGESMVEAQARALQKVFELKNQYRMVAIFSHGDIIRAVLAHFLGISLDLFQRIEISPGSVSLVELEDDCVHIGYINLTPDNLTGMNVAVPADTTGC